MSRGKSKLKLREPGRLPLVFPSILSADFARMGEDVEEVMGLGAHGIHVDVMDGHFVPNLTMGPAVLKSLRKRFGEVYFDVHLMVEEPWKFVGPFAEAGADCVSFHAEVVGKGKERTAREMVGMIREAGCDAAIVINPGTEVEAVEEVLGDVDMVLVMSVNPGFSGQAFMPEVLEKARWIRERAGEDVRLEMDGGIGEETAKGAREAGVDVLVAASAIFGAKDRGAAIKAIRGG